MDLSQTRVSGLEYLSVVTKLLQRARIAGAKHGQWDASDLQWWWRKPRESDAVAQTFWFDDHGPVAGVVFTDWGRAWGCDLITVPTANSPCISVQQEELWTTAIETIEELKLSKVEVLARDDHHELCALLAASGFEPDETTRGGITWMNADDRPSLLPMPDGFELVDRATRGGEPHPMQNRNGGHVEDRLRQCSLYDPSLDLSIRSPNGDVAGYGLFWFDQLTKVGVVEPMRVEDAYQRGGLARALLAAGLERLANRGATRFKVMYATGPAHDLYTGVGFEVAATDQVYVWSRGFDL
jgi:predicted N-acetyltransferase YhbS